MPLFKRVGKGGESTFYAGLGCFQEAAGLGVLGITVREGGMEGCEVGVGSLGMGRI